MTAIFLIFQYFSNLILDIEPHTLYTSHQQAASCCVIGSRGRRLLVCVCQERRALALAQTVATSIHRPLEDRPFSQSNVSADRV